MAASSTIFYSVNASFQKVNDFTKTVNKNPFCSASIVSIKGEKLALTGKVGKLYTFNRRSRIWKTMASSTTSTEIEKLGIKIVKNPTEAKLTELGVRSWPKWGCEPSKFPWTYSARETCLLLKGKVKVYPDGSDEAVEIGAGDLVIFPRGMSCTWDVSETVDKHYKFD